MGNGWGFCFDVHRRNKMLDYIEAAVFVVVLLGLAGWFYLEKR